ncbi:MAG: dioxygenase [Deltaproteobacteria bacterium]|nr:MAG: dioxygenase [Deltaproteobacteria bacterium]
MTARQPVVYLPHGGGPWPFVELGMPKQELADLAGYLRSLVDLPPEPPKAVLMISAHWEEAVPTVMTAERPPMLYDYYNFPPAAYEIQWPAPGSPQLAARVRELLGEAGFDTAENASRGFDHGAFVPLKVMYPNADIPTVQLSLVKGLDPAKHIELGRALAPLRDEGVYILASGMSYHNLRALFSGSAPHKDAARAFDQWIRDIAGLDPDERNAQLEAWRKAPGAIAAHPREEHLLPLMVAAGAAGSDAGVSPWSGPVMGFPVSAVHFG